jgi:replicative DNA helicase
MGSMPNKRQRLGPPAGADRFRPVSLEAEQAVLGGLLLSPHAFDAVGSILIEEDFSRHEHRIIFRAIARLVEANEPCDAVTLGEWFEAQGLVESVSSAYVLELVSTTPSAANVRTYAEIVREKSILRQIIDACAAGADMAFNPEDRGSGEVLAQVEGKLFAIANARLRGRQGFIALSGAMKGALEQLEERYNARSEDPNAVLGLPTGYTQLDEITTGLQPSDLIIVAARPSMGKTALALNMAEFAALRTGKTVAIFSMEMSASQLAFRLISSAGRINQQRLRTGLLDDEEWGRLSLAMTTLAKARIYIDDTPALEPNDLRTRARRLSREHGGLGLIVIDYLQLMQAPNRSENRTAEISEISRSLKALAKELNVPVIELSQLNRGLEQRSDKRPVMSDLRDSGAIEQDADVIVFIYRDEYYHKDSPDAGTAEIIIAKQRNGPTDTARLAFQGQYTRFDNLASGAWSGGLE